LNAEGAKGTQRAQSRFLAKWKLSMMDFFAARVEI